MISDMCRTVLGMALVLGLAVQAQAGELIVFGDSFSDTGNTAVQTQGQVPGPDYWWGRYSNGRVWSEHLADSQSQWGIEPALLGGLNYAYGGAMTVTPDGATPRDMIAPGVPFIDMDQQVIGYLKQHGGTAASDDLFVLWGGANDFLMGNVPQTDPQAAAAFAIESASNIISHISRLYQDGNARQFLVLNLPPLGQIPRFNDDPVSREGLNNLAGLFNQTLEQGLQNLEGQFADIQIARLDTFALYWDIAADPAAYGLTNVSDPIAPGLTPGGAPTGPLVDEALRDGYLFWDPGHISEAGHAIIGQAALQSLSQVPEPASASLLMIGATLLIARRRRA